MIKVTKVKNGRKHIMQYHCRPRGLCGFFFNGRIRFDIRGQHEFLEVKVITNIRTIINYPIRPLLVYVLT